VRGRFEERDVYLYTYIHIYIHAYLNIYIHLYIDLLINTHVYTGAGGPAQDARPLRGA